MKLKSFCLPLLLFTFSFSLQSQIIPFSEEKLVEADSKSAIQDNQTAVTIKTNYRKAAIYLNGTYKGLTPLAITKLTPGTYFLRIDKNNFLPVECYIEVENGIASSFYFNLEEEVSQNEEEIPKE